MSKLKITVKSTKPQKKVIRWQDLPIGTVFKYEDNVTGLKIIGDVLLLTHSDGALRLDTASAHSDIPITAILGQLKEMIVEKE